MGRGDGTGRIVSHPDADDTGAGILHVDMDAFYASVEVLDDPSLRGKPIIVGAPEGRSVVSSASYEARRFGVRSAMPVSQALRLCPTATVVTPHFDRYVALSRQVMSIFRDITPLVEPLSIDEAFLDVRGARRLWGSPRQVAVALRERVLADTGLTCSVGGAATKHVAKIASTLSKPDGLLIIAARDTQRFLADRPVSAIWGVGPKAAEALAARGIRLVRDVLQTPDDVLDRALGPAMGLRVRELSRGIDERPVTTDRVEKSISHEETFHDDVDDDAVVRREILRLADRVAVRLRAHELRAGAVSIKVRFADFTTVTRTRSLTDPSDVGQRLADVARALYAELDRPLAVRLIGVRAERLTDGASSLLWDDDEDQRRLEGTLDAAVGRFGAGVITRAALVKPPAAVGGLPTAPRIDDAFGDGAP